MKQVMKAYNNNYTEWAMLIFLPKKLRKIINWVGRLTFLNGCPKQKDMFKFPKCHWGQEKFEKFAKNQEKVRENQEKEDKKD